ncbi:MAG: ABC transporter permease [Ardenticatenaceae bacterium]|nr:ABC transporter permease [Ardenticatenaceae bacterium]
MMRRFIAVLIKEAREIWRDPYTLGMAIVLPLIMLFLFAYATNLDVKDVSLAIYDQDRSRASRDYVTLLTIGDEFHVHAWVQSSDELEHLMDNDTVEVGLIIPPGFGEALAAGQPATVQTWVDGSFPPTANVAIGYVTAFNQVYSAREVAALLGQPVKPAIAVAPRVSYNPGLKSVNSVVPGLFAVILLAFPPLLSALSVVREKERGSIQQLFVSPIRPAELILGKLIPYGVIAFVEMAVIFVAGIGWFQVPFVGSLPFLLVTALIYVFGAVSIGLLVSTVTSSQAAAMIATIVLTMMPALIFSGFIYPIFNMPPVMQWYTNLFPARHFVTISRSIALKGVGLEHLWPHVGLLLAYVLAIFTMASLRFKKKVG